MISQDLSLFDLDQLNGSLYRIYTIYYHFYHNPNNAHLQHLLYVQRYKPNDTSHSYFQFFSNLSQLLKASHLERLLIIKIIHDLEVYLTIHQVYLHMRSNLPFFHKVYEGC